MLSAISCIKDCYHPITLIIYIKYYYHLSTVIFTIIHIKEYYYLITVRYLITIMCGRFLSPTLPFGSGSLSLPVCVCVKERVCVYACAWACAMCHVHVRCVCAHICTHKLRACTVCRLKDRMLALDQVWALVIGLEIESTLEFGPKRNPVRLLSRSQDWGLEFGI